MLLPIPFCCCYPFCFLSNFISSRAVVAGESTRQGIRGRKESRKESRDLGGTRKRRASTLGLMHFCCYYYLLFVAKTLVLFWSNLISLRRVVAEERASDWGREKSRLEEGGTRKRHASSLGLIWRIVCLSQVAGGRNDKEKACQLMLIRGGQIARLD